MQPVTVEVTIGRPREEIFEYLADIANHAEFTDHYLKDWHLTREDSYGLGAGARFRLKAPGNRFPWGDATLTEMTAPTRIVERGRGGKFNRNRTIGIYELESLSKHHTRVRFTFESLPAKLTDRFLESFGASFYLKRQNAKALRRLRLILEEDRARGKRATVAGGARKPASQYRF
ncbi:MAG TPA: hypothetical protein VNT22_06560 [Baekduia sp.]|nr:hypothetical protein [Baekduia sp.]